MSRPLRIFVIEDYDALRHAICEVLTRDGHEVVGVAMAEDVDDEPTRFVSDVYIVDINLPGEDGVSLARRIRQSQPDAGIVMVSARTSVDDRIGSYQSGANTYLTKPLSIEELRAVVNGFSHRVFSRQQPRDVSLTVYQMSMLATGPEGQTRLTQPEIALLAAFSRSPQQSLEHWQAAIHLGQGEVINKDALEVRVGRLRKKLVACCPGPVAIQSLRGFGYKLCVPVIVKD
jgi:DNA-binding response OmpR family regulator